MKRILLAVAIVSMFAVPAPCADAEGKGGKGANFEQKKAEVLGHIDQRISLSQQEKVCVQGAKTHDELRACREKFRPEHPKGERPQGGGR